MDVYGIPSFSSEIITRLIATISLVSKFLFKNLFYIALYTEPYAPCPIFSYLSYLSIFDFGNKRIGFYP